jgi:diguanylate cyclase (GGDEF)-like protein
VLGLLVRQSPLVQLPDWVFAAVVVVALAAVATVVLLLVGVRTANRRSGDDWETLGLLAPELVGQTDEAAILRVALADAARLFRCRRAEVHLYPARHRPALVAAAAEGTDEPVDVHSAPAADVPFPAATAIPLHGSEGEVGRLLLIDCPRAGTASRRRLAGAFAHMLASSLAAAHALGEERRLVEETEQRATQDDLTHLGNRWLLDRWGDHLLAVSRSQGRTAAVLLLDADDFKRINDTLGHDGGDRVLAEMGRRIRRAVRDTDLAVRLGGDEFAVLTGDLTSPDDAERLAERLLGQLAAPVVVDDVHIGVQASLGIAVSGEDGDDLDALLRSADEAMYAAKSSGPGQWRRATGGAERPRADRGRIVAELRDGLPVEQILLHYQPQVDATTGELRGFEALARWQHPELGLLTPSEFVPLAERAGLMTQLTAAVLDHALRDQRVLAATGPGVRISVNVTARNLLHHGLVAEVARDLDAHQATAALLTLEVAEPSVGTDASVADVFGQLAELGCRISVSEYGTGQSSLTALAHLRGIREIKVNPGLVGRLPGNEDSRRLLRAITTAAHSLRVEVVAEGVESVALVREVRELGCDVLQGYHIGSPAPLDEVLGWAESWPGLCGERLGLPRDQPRDVS